MSERETNGAPQTAPEPEKPIVVDVTPESRVHTDPKLWDEAGRFADMLTYCRPDGSKTERKFIAKYIVPLGVKFDKKGNAYKQIGDKPEVLWSCHTDTVHNANGFQKVEYYLAKKTGEVYFQAAAKPKTSCLGADDTAGIWLMTEMIKAEIPGLYIFHRGEECGGIGSKWIADKNKDALVGIKYAIAFDRRDEKSIITYQRSRRCCSDEFAESLAAQLGLGHKCDTTGSFTDTASYVDLVAECTNVSVGYDFAHCANEHINVDYLFRLRDAVLKLDLTKLVEKRKAGENTYRYTSYHYDEGTGFYNYWNKKETSRTGGYSYFDLTKKHQGTDWMKMGKYEWDHQANKWFDKLPKSDLGVVKTYYGSKAKEKADEKADSYTPTYKEAMQLILNNPDVILDLLESQGYGPKEIKNYILDMGMRGSMFGW